MLPSSATSLLVSPTVLLKKSRSKAAKRTARLSSRLRTVAAAVN